VAGAFFWAGRRSSSCRSSTFLRELGRTGSQTNLLLLGAGSTAATAHKKSAASKPRLFIHRNCRSAYLPPSGCCFELLLLLVSEPVAELLLVDVSEPETDPEPEAEPEMEPDALTELVSEDVAELVSEEVADEDEDGVVEVDCVAELEDDVDGSLIVLLLLCVSREQPGPRVSAAAIRAVAPNKLRFFFIVSASIKFE
jgi:hypothetical protein